MALPPGPALASPTGAPSIDASPTGVPPALTAAWAPLNGRIKPQDTAAEREFDLALVNADGWDCGTVFDSAYATIWSFNIYLFYQAHRKPDADCRTDSAPHQISFRIPALPARYYTVYAWDLGRCPEPRMPATDCRRMIEPDLPGATLKLGSGFPPVPVWRLEERLAPSNTAFRLQLLRDDVGRCRTGFRHMGLTLDSGGIFFRFQMERIPNVLCGGETVPWGPDTLMPSLRAGLYPIHAVQLPDCVFKPPYCPSDWPAPSASDTLVVSDAVALPLSGLRARAAAIELRGGTAFATLPAGREGIWQAAVLSLDGRVREEAKVAGGPGSRVAIPVDKAPFGTLSLLRLTAPEGARTYLPLQRE